MAESGKRGYTDITISFGKHKGKLLADVPNSYVAWLARQEFVEVQHAELFRLVQLEMKYRYDFNIIIEE